MANAHPTSRAKLLKPAEVTACKQLSASQQSDSPRAAALLAIHQGATQAAAAESSGLSIGQVKYIVTRFRKLGMAALTTQDQQPAVEEKAKPVGKKAKVDKKTKKDKKDKKEKKDKKKVKDKSDKKKAKKEKKTKKKSKNKK